MLFSISGGVQYTGGYYEYSKGDTMSTPGDTMSTLEAYHDECEDIMSTLGCSIHRGLS